MEQIRMRIYFMGMKGKNDASIGDDQQKCDGLMLSTILNSQTCGSYWHCAFGLFEHAYKYIKVLHNTSFTVAVAQLLPSCAPFCFPEYSAKYLQLRLLRF